MNEIGKYIQKTIRRLIKNSQGIHHEIEVLTNLSFHDREDTEQFLEHITDISNYLNGEAVIINNLSLENLEMIYKELPKYDDNTDAFERISIIIDEKIKELYEEYGYSIEDKQDEEDTEIYDKQEDINESTDIDSITNAYIIDEEISETEANRYIDDIAIIVLKKMHERILNTTTDNKNDSKYKNRLIKQLKVFKYFVFTLDLRLEKLGVKYKFNLDSIPTPFTQDINPLLSRNQCIASIEKLYKVKNNESKFSEINEALFNMMLLEIYLEYLTDEDIDKLIEMCNKLNNYIINSFYGNIVMDKLVKKKEKIN